MHSLTQDYLARLRFDTQQLATLRALGEYRGKQRLYVAQSPEVLSDLRQVAVIESTESSNRLEGIVVAATSSTDLELKAGSGVDQLSTTITHSPTVFDWGSFLVPSRSVGAVPGIALRCRGEGEGSRVIQQGIAKRP